MSGNTYLVVCPQRSRQPVSCATSVQVGASARGDASMRPCCSAIRQYLGASARCWYWEAPTQLGAERGGSQRSREEDPEVSSTLPGNHSMGPERVFPNQTEDLGEVQEPPVTWSGGEDEEEEEGEVQNGYQYEPLNQEPEEGAQNQGDIQERLQAMRLHLPDPPVDSEEDEEDENEAAHSSIPMDAAHVELVKKAMAGVKLSSLSVPVWAQQLSDADWENLVDQTIQSRSTSSPSCKK